MITWGISANSHDAALAVFVDKKLVFASHSERFSRLKNDPDLSLALVNYALQWGSPDEVIWYEKPLLKTLRQFQAGQGIKIFENNIKRYLKKYGIRSPIHYVDHHLSHAAGGYFTSGYNDATVICIDAIGEYETYTIWKGYKDKLDKVHSESYPDSLGLWYSAMTQRIGLKPNEDEYILMGMSAYGKPTYAKDILDDHFLEIPSKHRPILKMKQNFHRGCQNYKKTITKKDYFDIAHSTQKIYEMVFEGILAWAKHNLPSKNLVLTGGCALNCLANSLAYKYFDNVWIMPNPGDAGSAVGCVLAYYNFRIDYPNSFLGYDIDREYPVDDLLSELTKTGIVGVANGKAEYGPRALGNRSLVADPRGSGVRDRVNTIKNRQKFRPFAPAILEEHADDFFDGPVGPFMQFVANCRQPNDFPGIVHTDGTSRVQTVARSDDSGFRHLLEEWYKRTGCPMLLNTSLNIKGKPIVNNEQDARMFEDTYNVKVY